MSSLHVQCQEWGFAFLSCRVQRELGTISYYIQNFLVEGHGASTCSTHYHSSTNGQNKVLNSILTVPRDGLRPHTKRTLCFDIHPNIKMCNEHRNSLHFYEELLCCFTIQGFYCVSMPLAEPSYGRKIGNGISWMLLLQPD